MAKPPTDEVIAGLPYRPGRGALTMLVFIASCILVWALFGFIFWDWNVSRWAEINRAAFAFAVLVVFTVSAFPIWMKER